MSVSLKKLWNDYGIAAIIFSFVLMYVLVVLGKYFSSKGSYGAELLSNNGVPAYGGQHKPMGNNHQSVQPSEPLGQNEVFSSVNGAPPSGQGIPSACNKQNIQNPNDLLPKDSNSQWAQLNPAGQGDLANINLLKAGYHIGIDTIGQSLRNANLQIRSEPPNPQLNVGPWNQSTITSDFMRPTLEIGQGTQ